jgi:hypothetical protein
MTSGGVETAAYLVGQLIALLIAVAYVLINTAKGK